MRSFLALAAGAFAALMPVAGQAAHSNGVSWTGALAVAAGAAAVLSLLGLFMTWGDEGSRAGNAARSIAVLAGFATAVIALLAWGASTASHGG